MFLEHPQVLFYARPSNSQILFNRPENEPISWDFDKYARPWGSVKLKCGIIPKKSFWVTFKFCFILDLRIPNFYSANLEMAPPFMAFDEPIAHRGYVELKS